MSTTLASMVDEVKLALGNRDDMTTAMVTNWLNRSQLALATRLRIMEIEAAVTFVVDPNQADPDLYGVPVDLFTPIIMVNKSQNRAEVRLRPIAAIMTKLATPPGVVSEYGLRAKSLILRPAPASADELEWLYKKRMPSMSDTVNMTLPDEFGEALVFDAIVRGMHLNGEEDRAQVYRAHRDDSLAKIGDQRGDEFGSREEGVIITGHDVTLA